jgi:hypothetical protein
MANAHWTSRQTETSLAELLAHALYTSLIGDPEISMDDRKASRFLAESWWQATHAGFFDPQDDESWKKLENEDLFHELNLSQRYQHYFNSATTYESYRRWLHEQLPTGWHTVWKSILQHPIAPSVKQTQTLMLLDTMKKIS